MDLSDIPHFGLDAGIGLRFSVLEPDRVVAAFEVTPELLDGTGSLHRGVISAVVESAASVGGAAWYADRGQAVGLSNTTSHFAPIHDGRVDVVAQPVGQLETRQLWTVSVTSGDVLLARGDVALANVPDARTLGR